jgi:AICAR transformylase/IMP cyclohydrolase PurH
MKRAIICVLNIFVEGIVILSRASKNAVDVQKQKRHLRVLKGTLQDKMHDLQSRKTMWSNGILELGFPNLPI